MATTPPGGYREGSAEAREFETLLRDRYEDLWQDIQRELRKYRGQRFNDIVQQGADPDDLAVADLLVDLNIAEINRDVEELRAIQHALERLRHGTYGICARCGEPIDPNRLRALPHAALCVNCQALVERQTGESPSL